MYKESTKGDMHDAIAFLIHWTLSKQAGCQVRSPWWRHTPTTVWENDEYKVLWDFKIVTDSVICHDRPDIVLMHKTSNEIFMVDVAIPGESCISQKTVVKLTKYVDLKIEVSRLWKTKNILRSRLLLVHSTLSLLIYPAIWSHSICHSTWLQCFKEL